MASSIIMAVLLRLPSGFDRFRREGEIVGRIVVEYGELEWDLCLLVAAAIANEDLAVRSVYGVRGEEQRINRAKALAQGRFPNAALNKRFLDTISQIHECRKIRNDYAHTNWVEKVGPILTFVKIENLTKSSAPIDLSKVETFVLTLPILEDQQRYFVSVMQNVRYMIWETQALSGAGQMTGFHYLDKITPPMKAKPL